MNLTKISKTQIAAIIKAEGTLKARYHAMICKLANMAMTSDHEQDDVQGIELLKYAFKLMDDTNSIYRKACANALALFTPIKIGESGDDGLRAVSVKGWKKPENWKLDELIAYDIYTKRVPVKKPFTFESIEKWLVNHADGEKAEENKVSPEAQFACDILSRMVTEPDFKKRLAEMLQISEAMAADEAAAKEKAAAKKKAAPKKAPKKAPKASTVAITDLLVEAIAA